MIVVFVADIFEAKVENYLLQNDPFTNLFQMIFIGQSSLYFVR